ALEAVQREVDFAQRAGRHPNVVRCHGVLVQNEGTMHSQLLLCEPCVTDLAAHIAGGLAVREASDVGQQLAFGLGHLHSHGILYGGFDAAGVLRGGDGLWKLGSFGRCALLPVAASEWLERREGEMSTPPEARSSTDDALKPEADVWLLGAFLGFLLSARPSGAGPQSGAQGLGIPDLESDWNFVRDPLDPADLELSVELAPEGPVVAHLLFRTPGCSSAAAAAALD
ncbi:unnamed protein product, partial [Effrenium voratum]